MIPEWAYYVSAAIIVIFILNIEKVWREYIVRKIARQSAAQEMQLDKIDRIVKKYNG